MNRVRIATEDNKKVQQNIENKKLNIISFTTPSVLERLLNHINNAGNAIIFARSDIAHTYPMDKFENTLIDGSRMCKLVAIRMTILVFKTIIVDNKDITIALFDKDLKYVKQNKLDEIAVLGYMAIHGELPDNDERRDDYNKNISYYQSMGILLNDKDRCRCSWMKHLYRRYRYCVLEYLMEDLCKRNILTSDEVGKLLSSLEVIKNDPSYYNLNQYIYYLCEVVGVVDIQEKNLFMTILSDDDGFEFVGHYSRTKYNTRRNEICQEIDVKKLLNISGKRLLATALSSMWKTISMSGCYLKV